MTANKKLGIIGGMGSVAAAYMFHRIIELTPTDCDQEYIETFVHNNTAIPDRTKGVLYGGESPLAELQRSTRILNDSGADYIVLACMTSHHFIPELQEDSAARFIDGIAETARQVAEEMPSIARAGILASTGAVKLSLFQNQLQKRGIEPVVLNDDDQETYFMEPIYKSWGIKAGNITGRPQERFIDAVKILADAGAEVVVAGCSELPLVLKGQELPVPIVDSIDALANAAVGLCFHRKSDNVIG
jgi:aspartate racemase